MPSTDELILSWANTVLSYVQEEKAAKFTTSALPMTASSMRAAITPTDEHGLIFAGQARVNEKWQPGTLMVFSDRVHYSWSEGLFRPKEHTVRIDFPRESSVLIDEGDVRESRVAMPMRKLRLQGTPAGHVFGIPALGNWKGALTLAQGVTEGWADFASDEEAEQA